MVLTAITTATDGSEPHRIPAKRTGATHKYPKAFIQRTDLQAHFISHWFDYRFRDLRAQAENDYHSVFLQNLTIGVKNNVQPLDQFGDELDAKLGAILEALCKM